MDNSKLYGAYDMVLVGHSLVASGTKSENTNLASVTGVPHTREHGDTILAMGPSGNNVKVHYILTLVMTQAWSK